MSQKEDIEMLLYKHKRFIQDKDVTVEKCRSKCYRTKSHCVSEITAYVCRSVLCSFIKDTHDIKRILKMGEGCKV